MKRKLCFLILFILGFTLLTGCSLWKSSAIGEIIQSGDWIYYSEGNTIYRLKTDGTGKTKLADKASLKTVADDVLYYFGDSGFSRMNTDGTENKALFDDPTTDIVMSGDWIYYACKQPLGIYKIRTDGTEKTMLTDLSSENDKKKADEIGVCGVSGDLLFYNIGETLYSMNSDGTEQAKAADHISVYAVKDNWIIYGIVDKTKKNMYQKLCKMKLDGTEESEIVEGEFEFLNIDREWIYYSNNPVAELYRLKLDGTDPEKVDTDIQSDSDMMWFRSVYGDWIFYEEQNEIGPVKTYGISMDGSKRIDFSK